MAGEPELQRADDHLEQQHREAEEEEEDVHPRGGIAKPKRSADIRRDLARLDEQNAHVREDEGQLDRRHQRRVLSALEGLDREAQSEEHDADEDGDEHPRLLELLADQHDRASQRQLAQHLNRLPPKGGRVVIPREESRRATERRWRVGEQRVAARPQQHRVEHGDPNRPERDHPNRHTVRLRVLLRVARDAQVIVHVPPCVVRVVLEAVAQECLEDERRGAGDEEERDHQDEGDRALQPYERHAVTAALEVQHVPLLPLLARELEADEARGDEKHEGDGPQRADQEAPAVRAEAGRRDEGLDAKVGRELDDVQPPGEVLQAWRSVHVEDGRHRGDALEEPHHHLQLAPHPRALPQRPEASDAFDHSVHRAEATFVLEHEPPAAQHGADAEEQNADQRGRA
mmetsp:Transcript_23449/g.56440  ORF Transcript_23449/g.56440 Transcript_23449/m.56440 type:complete len:401 (+) Transcript_23449:1870-3072(+)